MFRIFFLMLASIGLIACATPPASVDALKNLYEVEPVARKMNQQKNVALLYLTETSSKLSGYRVGLSINYEQSMDMVRLNNEFYVFCLLPGEYNIGFLGDGIVPNKYETIKVKAGDVLVREFFQIIQGVLFIPLIGSHIKEVDLSSMKNLIATKRIGTDAIYANSQYRCRSMT